VALGVLRPTIGSHLSQYALAMDSVASDDFIGEEDGLLLCGFPGELTNKYVDEAGKRIELGFRSVCYGTGLHDPPPDKRGRYRVYWTDSTTDDGGIVSMPDPSGISGGGLWRFRRVPKGELWSAQASGRLIGINEAWNQRDTEFVTPVRAWREWLSQALADLDLEPTQRI
jgi:hypothetical protein